MKRPLLNYWQRTSIRFNTYEGACLKLYIAELKWKRELKNKFGWLIAWLIFRDYKSKLK